MTQKENTEGSNTWPKPLVAFVPVSDILFPLVGVKDPVAVLPHQYIFLQSRDKWSSIFRKEYLHRHNENNAPAFADRALNPDSEPGSDISVTSIGQEETGMEY